MQLNFKPTKVPIYEIEDAAGIRYPHRVGTRDSRDHCKVTKKGVTFRVKRGVKEGREIYYLDIEYLKECIFEDQAESFEDGFKKAEIWADSYLNDREYLNKLVFDIREERRIQQLNEERVDTMEKARTIKIPYYSKYQGEYIYDIMQTDLDYCVAYYVGNLSFTEFDFSELQVSPLWYETSSERTTAYNCIKYLLNELHPNIAKDLLGYFKNMTLEEAKEITLKSGKYKDKKLETIYAENSGYIDWYLGNVEKTIYNIRLLTAMDLIKKHC